MGTVVEPVGHSGSEDEEVPRRRCSKRKAPKALQIASLGAESAASSSCAVADVAPCEFECESAATGTTSEMIACAGPIVCQPPHPSIAACEAVDDWEELAGDVSGPTTSADNYGLLPECKAAHAPKLLPEALASALPLGAAGSTDKSVENTRTPAAGLSITAVATGVKACDAVDDWEELADDVLAPTTSADNHVLLPESKAAKTPKLLPEALASALPPGAAASVDKRRGGRRNRQTTKMDTEIPEVKEPLSPLEPMRRWGVTARKFNNYGVPPTSSAFLHAARAPYSWALHVFMDERSGQLYTVEGYCDRAARDVRAPLPRGVLGIATAQAGWLRTRSGERHRYAGFVLPRSACFYSEQAVGLELQTRPSRARPHARPIPGQLQARPVPGRPQARPAPRRCDCGAGGCRAKAGARASSPTSVLHPEYFHWVH
ncbi:hypothetical protein WJX81_003846 [Elliptochloris bilobata]|uniref:Post-SET domain-containing protein n=1 Tax=Elliptochloris bilobata TaxID=381761 RepID=A0AAW1SD61_9CHLO